MNGVAKSTAEIAAKGPMKGLSMAYADRKLVTKGAVIE
jgi:hypothetical protein